MIRLIVIVLVGALIWMSWWAIGQTAYEKGVSAWIDDRRGEGWVADLETLETKGFPNRFDTTLTELHLADPDTGIAWTTPKVQILSLAYKPHQVIAVLAPSHRFSTPFETLTLSHEDARASLFLKPTTSLALDRARLVIDTLKVTSTRGWDIALTEGRFAAESTGDNSYRLGIEALGLMPTQDTRDLLDPAGLLPEQIENLRLDADLAFDRPWDRFAVEDARPQVTAIDLGDLSARWGNVTFRAAGEVTVDALGTPEGEVTLRAVEWRKLLAMAHSVGWLHESLVGPSETALELLSGNTDTLDATLVFEGGRTWLGPIPLGPAPILTIR